MRFAEVPLAMACEAGAVLAHAVMLGGRRRAKGTPVTPELVAEARAHGLAHLWIARPDAGDMPEAEAAIRIASGLAGAGIVASPPVHGRVNLCAAAAGLLCFEPDRIAAANAATEDVGIATLPPLSPVPAGALVATVKIIPFALATRAIAGVEASGAQLALAPFRSGLSACLLPTRLDATSAKQLAKTEAVTRARLDGLGIAMTVAPPVAHAVTALASALQPQADAHALLLVSGATATADPQDVIPAAIRAAGGTVTRTGMPVDPGNLLVLGTLGRAAVIGLPGCAKSPKRNGLDLVLERFAAGLPTRSADIARMGVGGLLEESGRPVPWAWSG